MIKLGLLFEPFNDVLASKCLDDPPSSSLSLSEISNNLLADGDLGNPSEGLSTTLISGALPPSVLSKAPPSGDGKVLTGFTTGLVGVVRVASSILINCPSWLRRLLLVDGAGGGKTGVPLAGLLGDFLARFLLGGGMGAGPSLNCRTW